MQEEIRLKEGYILARCCSPTPPDKIIGYHSHESLLKVHRHDCPNLNKADPARLVSLEWNNIVQEDSFSPDRDYAELDEIDFAILNHHRTYGIDYSLMVASMVEIDRAVAFDRHKKLRAMGLLKRVNAVIVQYRKGLTDHKWIKHRNHTYYDLTAKGNQYLDYNLSHR